jgi:hypothetical protein
MFIPDPDIDFLPIRDPGVKRAPDSGSATRILTNVLYLQVWIAEQPERSGRERSSPCAGAARLRPLPAPGRAPPTPTAAPGRSRETTQGHWADMTVEVKIECCK